MATVALDRAGTRVVAETTTDRELIRSFLDRDRIFAAYALADLEERDPGRARIAVVGNVLTQPEFRGRGYAQATTAAVTTRLLEFCDHVVLNVRSDNPPALNTYRRLGYAEHVRFEERLGHRIGSLLADVASALRRFARNRESQPR